MAAKDSSKHLSTLTLNALKPRQEVGNIGDISWFTSRGWPLTGKVVSVSVS